MTTFEISIVDRFLRVHVGNFCVIFSFPSPCCHFLSCFGMVLLSIIKSLFFLKRSRCFDGPDQILKRKSSYPLFSDINYINAEFLPPFTGIESALQGR